MPLLTPLRQLAVAARDRMDARLHPRRRARAEALLAELGPRSVLVLCLGNVCRSPYAARVLAERLPDLHVESAGFIGPGRSPPEVACKVARARGVDHADHRSRTIALELVERADVIFVFDRFNVARVRGLGAAVMERVLWLGDFDPEWAGKRAIIDPWGKDEEEFDRTFARIERCVEQVARVLESRAHQDSPSRANH